MIPYSPDVDMKSSECAMAERHKLHLKAKA
jgi:hypothetical protein